jgi:hypothetical protein
MRPEVSPARRCALLVFVNAARVAAGRREVCRRVRAHAGAAALELSPDERQLGMPRGERRGTRAHLDEQRATRQEPRTRACDDALDDFEARLAAREPRGRLVPVLLRQLGHFGVRHVRRVRHDNAIARVAGREDVALEEPHALADAVTRDVCGRDLERGGRDVRRVDADVGV